MKQGTKRLLCLLMVIALLAGFAVPVSANTAAVETEAETKSNVTFTQVDNSSVSAPLTPQVAETEEETAEYANTDVVRVSIVLEEKSTVEMGYSVESIATNADAMAYRQSLKAEQSVVTTAIERSVGGELDVVWNLTLAANIISANVPYGQIEAIENVPGVAEVLLENQYQPDVMDTDEEADPNMSTSTEQIGSTAAWAAGYTGFGSRVAVIDTGTDTDHQSFSVEGWRYSLEQQAKRLDMTADEYAESLNLLDLEEIQSVAEELNVEIDPSQTYYNEKLAFGYNYVDGNYNITHDKDGQGYHGSHVAGIATANAWIPQEDGTFTHALESVLVQGVAPDAQLITMKVFGAKGGAYESDYIAAIEDAIILGADSINLSLGSAMPGYSKNTTAAYQAIFDSLTEAGAVVVMSAGNNYSWVQQAKNAGYLYAEDVNLQTGGSPGTYTNSLSVASVDNSGTTGYYVKVGQDLIFYNENTNSGAYSNALFTTIAGEHEYVFIDGIGTAEDWAAVGDALTGKIALCSRGSSSFAEKANLAVEAGAIAVFIYNNQPGVINMDLTEYQYTAPVASITLSEGALIRAQSTPHKDSEGNVLYYTGKMTISNTVAAGQSGNAYYTMSDFSSWGITGSLEMKPEITAPGGSIYSINGTNKTGKAYATMSGTSMAAPQVTGMVALVAQYIRENGLDVKTGLTARQLAQSLLMSTSEPVREEESGGNYYSILKQGSGLANVGSAVTADGYILMAEGMSSGASDGKVKVELGDDPQREGVYTISFTLTNLTEQEKAFKLYADFFTQDYFQYYANGNNSMDELAWYMDTWTRMMSAVTTWTVDGVAAEPTGEVDGMDFDGNGTVNTADGQALLNYLVGVTDNISSADLADIDADGDTDTYDAYLFFKKLGTSAVIVPAGESVQISVQVELTEEWDQLIGSTGAKGLYIEGFLYAKSLSSAEGVAGTTHSIPVLGFYGNWTDPSMFEVGTYNEYLTGEEIRTPYVGSESSNVFYISYGDEPKTKYVFTGNPLIPDETYMPERNAINSVYGDRISGVSYTAIRNAAASRIYAVNETTGEVLLENNRGAVTAACYSYSTGLWNYTGATIGMNVNPTGIREGDQLSIRLTHAPEYYVDDEGNVNWDALGEGASLTLPLVIDNTAPTMEGVSMDLVNNTLVVRAYDNRYIAAVGLYTPSGQKCYTATGAKQEIGLGESAEYVLDLTDVNGSKFLVQIIDYALNTTTYAIEVELGEPVDYTGKMIAFTTGDTYRGTGNRWVEIDKDKVFFYQKRVGGTIFRPVYENDWGGITDISNIDMEVVDAEYVGGYIFMAGDDGFMYVADMADMGYCQKVSSYGDRDIVGMAMNYADGKMYVMSSSWSKGTNNHYRFTISTMDLLTGEFADQYSIQIYHPMKDNDYYYTQLHGLAIDDEGTFYSVCFGGAQNETYLYTWTNEMFADGDILDLKPLNNTADGGIGKGYYGVLASLAWDHDADVLYMAGIHTDYSQMNNKLLIVDTETGKATLANDYNGGHDVTNASAVLRMSVTGLMIIPKSSPEVPTSKEPHRVELDRYTIEALPGATVKLDESVYPWSLDDKSVTWSSSDESVATVDQSGNVTTMGVGTATITATTVATPAVSAQCTVNVVKLDNVQFSGLVYDTDGSTYWADFGTDDLTKWTAASEKTDTYYAGTLMNGKIYAHNGTNIYRIDPDTFETEEMALIGGEWGDWQFTDAAPIASTQKHEDAKLLTIAIDGAYLCVVDPTRGYNGGITYWNYRDEFATDDPMTVVACYSSQKTGEGSSTHYYYFMTEGGALYQHKVNVSGYGKTYSGSYTYIGQTGVEMYGVSEIGGGKYASLEYDETTGYLFLSVYTEGTTASLYCIEPTTAVASKVGDFAEGVWPIVALHQWNRATELTVKLEPEVIDMFVRDTEKVKAAVLMGTSDELVWTSSDEAVAKVDANGIVTGVSAGTAVITATTTEKKADGTPASSSVTVNVTALTDVDMKLNAQIDTADGTKWVSINTDDMSYTVNGKVDKAWFGGGYGGNGLVLGADADPAAAGTMQLAGNLRMIEPSAGYSEIVGSGCSWGYATIDTTYIPSFTLTGTNSAGEEVTMETGESAVTVNYQPYVTFLDTTDKNNIAKGRIKYDSYLLYNNSIEDVVAITFIQTETYRKLPSARFIALTADGKLYRLNYTFKLDADAGTVLVGEYLSYLGQMDLRFHTRYPNLVTYYDVSMVYDGTGLIISDGGYGTADVYYVNLSDKTGSTYNYGKIGRVSGATDITALYTDEELNTAKKDSGENVATVNGFTFSTMETVNLPAGTEIAEINGGNMTVAQVWNPEEDALTDDTGETLTPNSAVEIGNKETTVTVTVKAIDIWGKDVAATNGLATVTYDTDKLSLRDVTVYGDYTAKIEADGTVTFGYVSLSGISAGDAVATLTFDVLELEDSEIIVKQTQVNNDKGNEECLNVRFIHSNSELRNYREATCTEDGYTGDSYCLDCGMLLSEGEVIPATGHSFGDWYLTTEPGCTEKGEETRWCDNCDAFETREVEAYCPTAGYTDVPLNQWYHDAVDYVVKNGLMNGMSETVFAPNANMTRAQLVTVLYRLAGEPSVEGLKNPFADVASDEWYTDAILWAADAGIVKGMTETIFAPSANVTREQLVTILYRFDGETEVDTAVLDGYTDADAINGYAVDAFAWAVETGIITGMTETTLAPQGTATRAQIATILMRYCGE